MDIEELFEVFLTLTFFVGLFLVAASVSARPRERQDWILCAGAMLGSLGVGLLRLAMGGNLFDSVPAGFAILGVSGLGVMLFSMGFLYDQLRTRRIVKLRKDLAQVPPREHA